MILRLPTALERVQSAVGLKDPQAGDPMFDALFLLRATQPDVALAQLGPAARAVLLRLHGLGLRFTLDERGLSGRGELPASAEDAETLLRSLVALRGALRAQTERRIYR